MLNTFSIPVPVSYSCRCLYFCFHLCVCVCFCILYCHFFSHASFITHSDNFRLWNEEKMLKILPRKKCSVYTSLDVLNGKTISNRNFLKKLYCNYIQWKCWLPLLCTAIIVILSCPNTYTNAIQPTSWPNSTGFVYSTMCMYIRKKLFSSSSMRKLTVLAQEVVFS